MQIPYRWVMVFLGGLMGCVAIGAMFSLAVFLDPMSAETGWSRAGISTAMTLDFLIMGVAGFLWGTLSDRYGPRPVVLIGAVLLGAGLLVASRATTPLTFQLGFGLLVGLSAGAFFAPMIAAVTGWFDTGRGLAVSLVSAGMGMAPLTFTPLAGWLIESYDWRTAMATMGVIAWVLLIPAAFFVRAAPAAAPSAAAETGRGRRRPRASLAAVHHPRRHLLPLLRRPLRPDLPHAELRHVLRHPHHGRGLDLLRRGPRRPRRPPPLRRRRRPPRREAR